MTDEQYQLYSRVIVASREFNDFTNKHIESAVGIRPLYLGRIITKLVEFGCFDRVGTRKNIDRRIVNVYQVNSHAITKLRNQYDKEIRENLPQKPKGRTKKVSGKSEENEFMSGIRFVDQANVEGMGNPMLMKIDSLLKGVRNELPIMQ